jgi:hypothetical protein
MTAYHAEPTAKASGKSSPQQLKPLVNRDEERLIEVALSAARIDVMGLHPVLGRLIGPQDDGPKAAA